MTSNARSEKSADWKRKTIRNLDLRARMEAWGGSIGLNRLEDEAERQTRQINAEDAAVRQSMGWPDPEPPTEGDDMRQTILGDVNNPPTVVMAGNQKSGLGPVAAMLLGMAIPGAGAAGFLLPKLLESGADPAPIVEPVKDLTDETLNLGLKKLSDLKQ